MSLTIPVEDLNRLQVSSHISIDGTLAIDLSLNSTISSEGLTYPSTNAKHCGITVTFKRSVNSDGSGWFLVMSTNFPDSSSFASGGTMPLSNENDLNGFETTSHGLGAPTGSPVSSEPNGMDSSMTQHSADPSHDFHSTNVRTTPGRAENLDPELLLQLMEYNFCLPSQISMIDMNDADTSLHNVTNLPMDCDEDRAQDKGKLFCQPSITLIRGPLLDLNENTEDTEDTHTRPPSDVSRWYEFESSRNERPRSEVINN
ncbi:hypothetical protein K435DRAFT_855901 [Dendrothele bispora CBS 962.96]|uniref:Uncharacterized protein n=1 Tax=Dendrothele bispora (strain CBS 962.96) TaxID=1314807 RepID=A0A4S8M9X7_DENBC|nr:hypothetical protein K435DRAFT_855901 [Dendrothele bispora CBS 962.96]